MRRRILLTACLVAAACSTPSLPPSLSDEDWWRLIVQVSEPHKPFRVSENLVSNEAAYAERVRWLRPSGGVYVGVGPEQNFSYIAALQPQLAFIVDIRRENLLLHLTYKAIFELSADRVEFVGRLFSRPRPAGLSSTASVDEIFGAYAAVATSPEGLASQTQDVLARLVETRRIPLDDKDSAWITGTLASFSREGPGIQFWLATGVEANAPTYAALMTARDTTGAARSFLATEEGFARIKKLHTLNLIVPVVGDFAGTVALQGIGQFTRDHHASVQAFYASNVGAYLNSQQTYAFCVNLAALPSAPGGPFIEGNRMQSIGARLRDCYARP